MGIVLAVKKKGVVCIAADSLTISGGSRRQTAEHVSNTDKIIKCGASYIGSASNPIWPFILHRHFNKLKRKPNLTTREEIFREFLSLHTELKEKYHLVIDQNDDDPFESSKFESLIVNSHGIFKTYELRSVQEFNYYSAIGSGAQYALGAIFALYDRFDSAEEIASAALNAATEFDDSTALPGTFYTVKLK